MHTPDACRCRRNFMTRLMGSLAAVPSLAVGARSELAQPNAAGDKLSTKSHMIDTGADLLQSKAPIDAMSVYLNGFHFYADDMGRQVEAHHFCTHLTEDLHQCMIFDANDKNARLIGVEYIVSANLFAALPDDEKKLWHSHNYEINLGSLSSQACRSVSSAPRSKIWSLPTERHSTLGRPIGAIRSRSASHS